MRIALLTIVSYGAYKEYISKGQQSGRSLT